VQRSAIVRCASVFRRPQAIFGIGVGLGIRVRFDHIYIINQELQHGGIGTCKARVVRRRQLLSVAVMYEVALPR
jgi:hypothetical protein